MIKITPFQKSIELAKVFRISRSAYTHWNGVRVTIEYEGLIAESECAPYARYSESVKSVIQQIESIAPTLAQLTPIEAKEVLQKMPAGAARNAIDCALWQIIAQQKNSQFPAPLFDIKTPIETAMTVSIGSAKEMAEQAKGYIDQGATLLKVKLDADDIIERVKAIRSVAPNAKIIIDANEAWGELSLKAIFTELDFYNITMIEQPVPAGQDQLLSLVDHPIPLCADESCHTRAELENLSGCYEMINIKLDKTGGLTEALALEKAAREKGFDIMVGCMLGTSISMKAALPVAIKASIVDLDGAMLLGFDEPDGLIYQNGTLALP